MIEIIEKFDRVWHPMGDAMRKAAELLQHPSLSSNLDFADIMDNMVDELVRKTSSAKEEHFKVAFEQTFGKPFDADKVYKKRLTRFIRQEDNTEYYSYCNRVFLIVRQNFDFGIENNTCSLSFDIPTKLYYTRKNGRVEFIDKAK